MKLTPTYSLILVKLMSRKADTPDFTGIVRNDIIKVTAAFIIESRGQRRIKEVAYAGFK